MTTPSVTAMHYEFLDRLRATRITNMFGAVPYLTAAFELTEAEARAILQAWMDSYGDRHPEHV
jgi:hypothetical protein